MAEKPTPLLDLWGQPSAPPKDPRGRKKHDYDPQVAEKIAILKAGNMDVETIAVRVGISEPTLRKYYLRALDRGRELMRAAMLEKLFEKGQGGNVSAIKAALAEIAKGDALPNPTRRRAPSTAEPKLGKKEAANRDAVNAHENTTWAKLLQ